jgi:hypothetical protein
MARSAEQLNALSDFKAQLQLYRTPTIPAPTFEEIPMSTNNLNPAIAARANANAVTCAERNPKPAPLLSLPATRYINIAVAKCGEPLHPKFAAKLKEDTAEIYAMIRLASCKAFDEAKAAKLAEPKFSKALVINAVKHLGPFGKRHVIQFLKDVASNAAFAAHMDIVYLDKQLMNQKLSEKELGNLGDLLDAETEDDLPWRDAPVEPYAGVEEAHTYDGPPIESEVHDAIESVQVYLAAICQRLLTTDDLVYWGIEGVFPLGTRKRDDGEYIPITTLKGYRTEQERKWDEKRKSVDTSQAKLDELIDID